MDIAAEFRRCLVELDVAGIKAVWAHAAPHLPAPANDTDALTALHMARTAAESVSFKLRAYSHSWLGERHLPSQLPDALKPSADRLYPQIVEAVGISVNFSSSLLKPAESLVRRAMEDAVSDVYAGDLHPDPSLVSIRMTEARERETQALFGSCVNSREGGLMADEENAPLTKKQALQQAIAGREQVKVA